MMSTHRLTSTSHLVLGLLAREGPSTPYDLEQHVRATLGNFWSFPHTLLYSEPPRLAAPGLAPEPREPKGVRRRGFAIRASSSSSSPTWRPTRPDCVSPSGSSPSTNRSSRATARTSFRN